MIHQLWSLDRTWTLFMQWFSCILMETIKVYVSNIPLTYTYVQTQMVTKSYSSTMLHTLMYLTMQHYIPHSSYGIIINQIVTYTSVTVTFFPSIMKHKSYNVRGRSWNWISQPNARTCYYLSRWKIASYIHTIWNSTRHRNIKWMCVRIYNLEFTKFCFFFLQQH